MSDVIQIFLQQLQSNHSQAILFFSRYTMIIGLGSYSDHNELKGMVLLACKQKVH